MHLRGEPGRSMGGRGRCIEIRIAIVYAEPQHSIIKSFTLAPGSSVLDALHAAASDADLSKVLLENSPLGIFGKLAYPRLNVRQIIGEEKMKESKFILEILEEEKLRNFLEANRAAILNVLRARFRSERLPKSRKTLSTPSPIFRTSARST